MSFDRRTFLRGLAVLVYTPALPGAALPAVTVIPPEPVITGPKAYLTFQGVRLPLPPRPLVVSRVKKGLTHCADLVWDGHLLEGAGPADGLELDFDDFTVPITLANSSAWGNIKAGDTMTITGLCLA
jgi:hypothetical protein